jgi:hypothetical protein
MEQLTNELQQLDIETFEIEDLDEVGIFAAASSTSTCGSTCGSCTSSSKAD